MKCKYGLEERLITRGRSKKLNHGRDGVGMEYWLVMACGGILESLAKGKLKMLIERVLSKRLFTSILYP